MSKLFKLFRSKKLGKENVHPFDGEIARKHNDNNVDYLHGMFDQHEEILRPYLVVTQPKKNFGPQSCPGGQVEPPASVVGSSRNRHHKRGTDRFHRSGGGRAAALMNGSFRSEFLPSTSRPTDPSSSDELEEALQRGGYPHVDDMRSKHGRDCGGRKRSPLADRSNVMIMGEESLRQLRYIDDYMQLVIEDKKLIRRLERALAKEKNNGQMEREERRRITQKYRSLADENDRQRDLIRDLQRKVVSLQNVASGLHILPTIPNAATASSPVVVPSSFYNNRQPLQQSNTTTPSSSNAPSEDRHRQHFTGSNNFAVPPSLSSAAVFHNSLNHAVHHASSTANSVRQNHYKNLENVVNHPSSPRRHAKSNTMHASFDAELCGGCHNSSGHHKAMSFLSGSSLEATTDDATTTVVTTPLASTSGGHHNRHQNVSHHLVSSNRQRKSRGNGPVRLSNLEQHFEDDGAEENLDPLGPPQNCQPSTSFDDELHNISTAGGPFNTLFSNDNRVSDHTNNDNYFTSSAMMPPPAERFFGGAFGDRWNTLEDDEDNEVKNFRSSHANSSSTSKQDFLGTDTEMTAIKHEFAVNFSPTSSITTARMESEFSFTENARGDSMNTSDVSRALGMAAASDSFHNSSDSTLVSEEVHDENHQEDNLLKDRICEKKCKVEDCQKLYPSISAPALSTSAKQNRSDPLLKISNRGKTNGRDDGYVTCNTSLTRL